jgi:hypothetical protein
MISPLLCRFKSHRILRNSLNVYFTGKLASKSPFELKLEDLFESARDSLNAQTK